MAMHSNFNDLKTKKMEATHLIKEKLIDGTAKRVAIKDVLIRQSDLADMLEEYHQAKLKLLGIGGVSNCDFFCKETILINGKGKCKNQCNDCSRIENTDTNGHIGSCC